MKQKRHKNLIDGLIEFIKLQLAGNILFWGTYLGYFISDYFLNEPSLIALASSSLIAHALFFIVSREWVFDRKGQRKSSRDIIRFIIFMTFNYFLNISIIEGLRMYADISPYIGQFISAFFFTAWNYIGLKFWVFEPKHVRHPALTYQAAKTNRKGVSRGRRATTNKKTTRAA